MIRLISSVLVLGCGLASGQLFEKPLKVGDNAPPFTTKRLNGTDFEFVPGGGKIVVIEWVNFKCPWVKKHYSSGHMQKLQRKWTAQEVVWISVATGRTAESRDLKNLYGSARSGATEFLLDPSGAVGKLYNAQCTPHCFIIDQKGILIYEGAIDSNKSTKVASLAEAENYVDQVLSSMVGEGKTPLSIKARPYGSRVQYKDF